MLPKTPPVRWHRCKWNEMQNQAEPDSFPVPPDLRGFKVHERQFCGSRLVYPVLSRRSGGISIGVNANPGQHCNFNCLYCQIHREPPGILPTQKPVLVLDLDQLRSELYSFLCQAISGELYEHERFRDVPANLRRLNDIALSGDGEPTATPQFFDICRVCVEAKEALALQDVKIIVITNASLLHQAAVEVGLTLLDGHRGEVWAKLDAGTEDYYRQVNRSQVPFERILCNVRSAAQQRPIVIQTLLMQIDGQAMDQAELAAYLQRLNEIVEQGGQIKEIQLHTVARKPGDPRAQALPTDQLREMFSYLQEHSDLPFRLYGV